MSKARGRIQPYVAAALRERLARYCAAQGITESACVEAALTEYLDQTHDRTLIMRRLDRLGRDAKRIQRDNQILLEALSSWVRIWFAHTPEIPEHAKPLAQSQSEKRYRRYIDHVARRLSSGERFLDDLPQDVVPSHDVPLESTEP